MIAFQKGSGNRAQGGFRIITVRGNAVDGSVKIGTAFKEKLKERLDK
jgi:hypothetical protein